MQTTEPPFSEDEYARYLSESRRRASRARWDRLSAAERRAATEPARAALAEARLIAGGDR